MERNMSDTDREPNSVATDPNAVLAELLMYCRSAAEECFSAGRDGQFSPVRSGYRLAGVKVVKASLDIIAAMKGVKAQSTHRFVYERQGPQGDPPPPMKKTEEQPPAGNGSTPPHQKNGGTTEAGEPADERS
jgi:hypothetical protein